MAEIQHLGSADDAKKGIVPKELSILEPIWLIVLIRLVVYNHVIFTRYIG
jgi:hypothetical protein